MAPKLDGHHLTLDGLILYPHMHTFLYRSFFFSKAFSMFSPKGTGTKQGGPGDGDLRRPWQLPWHQRTNPHPYFPAHYLSWPTAVFTSFSSSIMLISIVTSHSLSMWRDHGSHSVALVYPPWTRLVWLQHPWMPSMMVGHIHFLFIQPWWCMWFLVGLSPYTWQIV